MALVKRFRDGSILEFNQGNFDRFCVYLTRPGREKYAPLDIECFGKLLEFGLIYGNEEVYNDFVQVYDATNNRVEENTLNLIDQISDYYGHDDLEVSILFTVLYMAMIAEENKEKTKLGKRIKRLGVHQVLIENHTIDQAANFSRGLGWREIDANCIQRGF